MAVSNLEISIRESVVTSIWYKLVYSAYYVALCIVNITPTLILIKLSL